MINLPPRPNGSKIEVTQDFNQTILAWKSPSSLSRFLPLIFLLAWMGGWAFGEFAALSQVLSGNANPFIVFWLVAWTVGGIFCVRTIYSLARPARPQKLIFDSFALTYDPGHSPESPFQKQPRGMNPFAAFHRGKAVKVPKNELGGVKLERVGERQRLTFDHGADRIEVGEFLTEPEREWVFAVLQSWNRP